MEIEDALKHLQDREYSGSRGTLESLAGVLKIGEQRVVVLVERLEASRLLRVEGAELELTAEGRSIALQVIRIHRLWESYFADQTGVPASSWHKEADKLEHFTSPEALDELTTRTGDPRFDPHGDPIPTPSGEIPPKRGVPLSQLEPGRMAEVVHVEDEPQYIAERLFDEGVRFESRVRLIEASPERLRVEVEGVERLLSRVVAANVWVEPISSGDARVMLETSRLSALEVGGTGRVTRIEPACRGLQRRRLLDLGLVPGTVVKAELRSPAGDPTAYRIRGAMIALRREQADLIHIEEVGTKESSYQP